MVLCVLAFLFFLMLMVQRTQNLKRDLSPSDASFDGDFSEEGRIGTVSYKAYSFDEVLEPGTYLVYAKTTIVDRKDLETWEDDQTQTSFYRYRVGDVTSKKIADFLFENGESPTAFVYKEGFLVGNLVSTDVHSDLTAHNIEAFVGLTGSVQRPEVANSQVFLSKDGTTIVTYTIQYPFLSFSDEIPYTVDLSITRGSMQKKTVTYTPQDLGIQMGYARPVLLSGNGKNLYLALTVDSEGMDDLNPGKQRLWRYNLETETFTDLSGFFEQNNILFYQINPDTQQLIGVQMEVSQETNEVGFHVPVAPTTIHLLDLQTQQSRVLLHDGDWTYDRVMLSDDGSEFAFNLGEDGVWILPVQDQTYQSPFRQNPLAVADISGRLVDWIGDSLVVDRAGELVLYTPIEQKVFSLDRDIGNYHVDQDYQGVWYVGSVIVD